MFFSNKSTRRARVARQQTIEDHPIMMGSSRITIASKMSQKSSMTSSSMKSYPTSKKKTLKSQISVAQSRRTLKVFDNDVDVTPQPLVHEHYPAVQEQQQIALDVINLRQRSSTIQMMFPSGIYKGSSSVMRSPSIYTVPVLDDNIESFLSVNDVDLEMDDNERAPSPYHSSSQESRMHCPSRPEKVTIILRETETSFVFELPQLTADLDTPEGQAVKEENERYDFITVGLGSNRKLANAETQTKRIHMKSRSTYLARLKRMNQSTFVNDWVMFDTYNTPGLLTEQSGRLIEHASTPITSNNPQVRCKFSKISAQLAVTSPQDQMKCLYENPSFRAALEVMERIIASKLYIVAQKRFKGLIKADPCSLDLKFTYSLDLLWIHTCPQVKGRPVSCIRWNYSNNNILAAGYGASSKESNGLILIWCMKNPSQPDRVYKFDSPVSGIDWSRFKPNQLAVGFYDGTLRVIDVSRRDLVVLKKSSRKTSPTYSPHWQVQWWLEGLESELEHIYTSNQDGTIFCYSTSDDFVAREIMKIPRIEGKVAGVKRTDHCNRYDIPIKKNPGALLLQRHPTVSNIYLVGSEEGCVHNCSTNYLYHHIDSFLAHDGPIYSLEYSPFCSKIWLTCGADWYTRIWADGITEPLITLSTKMASVRAAAWSPINPTVIASCVNNEICIWDIKRRTYRPTSVTVSTNNELLVLLEFTSSGDQLVVADSAGIIYVYNLEGMPFPPYDQTSVLIEAIKKNLVTKPGLLKKLQKIGSPF